MCNKLITLITAILISSPALANTCTIVVSNDRASTREIRTHEIAHCACGEWHPKQTWIVPPKNYVSPKPPKHCLKYSGKLTVTSVPTKTAQAMCKRMVGLATFGCFKSF